MNFVILYLKKCLSFHFIKEISLKKTENSYDFIWKKKIYKKLVSFTNWMVPIKQKAVKNSVISVMMREWWWNLLCEFHLEKIRYSDWLELKMFIYSTKGSTNLGLHIWPQCLPLGRCCFHLLYIHINGFRHGWRKEKCLLVFKPFLQKRMVDFGYILLLADWTIHSRSEEQNFKFPVILFIDGHRSNIKLRISVRLTTC